MGTRSLLRWEGFVENVGFERELDFSLPKLFAPGSKSSGCGTFAPWNFRSLELSHPGSFAPTNEYSKELILRFF